jgi:hypothetical protein
MLTPLSYAFSVLEMPIKRQKSHRNVAFPTYFAQDFCSQVQNIVFVAFLLIANNLSHAFYA